MTEDEWDEAINEQWASEDDGVSAAIATARDGLKEHPQSPIILHMLGVLLERQDIVADADIDEALGLYQRAVEIDPSFALAWESIGYFLDTFREDFEAATDAFKRAITLGAGAWSYAGLARVLAQQDRRDEAMAILTKPRCPFPNEECIVRMRKQLESGYWKPPEE